MDIKKYLVIMFLILITLFSACSMQENLDGQENIDQEKVIIEDQDYSSQEVVDLIIEEDFEVDIGSII